MIKPANSKNGLKYQTDPRYRARTLERAAFRWRNPQTKEHKKLKLLRSKLHRLRGSLEDRLEHVRELAARIVALEEEEEYLKECIRWKITR